MQSNVRRKHSKPPIGALSGSNLKVPGGINFLSSMPALFLTRRFASFECRKSYLVSSARKQRRLVSAFHTAGVLRFYVFVFLTVFQDFGQNVSLSTAKFSSIWRTEWKLIQRTCSVTQNRKLNSRS